MAMRATARGRLTDRYIAALQAPEKGETIVRDGPGGIPGLLVRRGRRKTSWELRIERPPRRTQHLGDWLTMKEAEARAVALDVLARHRRGEPLEGPDLKAMTPVIAWPLYKADLERRNKSPRTIVSYQGSLNRMDAKVCTRTLHDLANDPTIMLREWERIADTKGKVAAMVTARFVRTLYRYIRKRHDRTLPDTHPCVDIDIRHIVPDDLSVMNAKQLPGWWKEVCVLGNPVRREAHLFCLLSGLRRNNLYTLEWANLDMEQGVMRVVQKGSKPFDVVLSRAMLRCLWRARHHGRRLHPVMGAKWVFPSGGSDVGHVTGFEKDGLSCFNHGLRRTYSTMAIETGVPEEVVDRLLGHQSRARPVMRSYVRDGALVDFYRQAQEKISAHIVRGLGAPRGYM